MADVKISKLDALGYDLFNDSESFLNELATQEGQIIEGGGSLPSWSPSGGFSNSGGWSNSGGFSKSGGWSNSGGFSHGGGWSHGGGFNYSKSIF